MRSERLSGAPCSAPERCWRCIDRGCSGSRPSDGRCRPVLFEQVLFNLLDNAAKYAPPGTSVRIQGWRSGDARSVCLQVLDEGQGIPTGELEHVFEKFRRAQQGDRVRAGTGSGSQSAAASSKRSGARSRQGTEATTPVLSSRSHCRRPRFQSNSTRRMSAPIRILVVDDEPPIELCEPASAPRATK